MAKSVDSVAFQKRKSMREGNNDKIENFEMEILDGGAPNKTLTVSKSLGQKNSSEDNL